MLDLKNPDLIRFVVYLAHTFNDRLALRSELEVEHAKVEPGGTAGELEIEQPFSVIASPTG